MQKTEERMRGGIIMSDVATRGRAKHEVVGFQPKPPVGMGIPEVRPEVRRSAAREIIDMCDVVAERARCAADELERKLAGVTTGMPPERSEEVEPSTLPAVFAALQHGLAAINRALHAIESVTARADVEV